MHALLGLAFLGAALKLSRGRSESFGEIPPPPSRHTAGYADWVKKTYARGTSVRLKKPLSTDYWCWEEEARSGELEDPEEEYGTIPSGKKMEVVDYDRGEYTLDWVEVEELFTSSRRRLCQCKIGLDEMEYYLEPLDDNWGPLVIAPKTQTPHPSPSWQRQMRQSRSWKARRP